MKKYFLTILVLLLSWGSAFAYLSTEGGVLVSTPETAAEKAKSNVDESAQDASAEMDIEKEGKAIVDEIDGKAMLTKSGNPDEKKIKVGDLIGAGDSVYTEKGASLTISFDNEKLNTVKIPAESKAVFVSIKPAEIKLENGSIFNSVDGLAVGSTWKISTPAAIAAVRGTQFEVEYSETTGEFNAATFEDSNESKASAVEIQSPAGGPAVPIKEGREMAFKRGQPFSVQSVKTMSPDRAKRGQKMMRVEGARRKEFVERKKERELKNGPNGPNGPGGGSGGEGHKRDHHGANANQLNKENDNRADATKVNSADGPRGEFAKSEFQGDHLADRSAVHESRTPMMKAQDRAKDHRDSPQHLTQKRAMLANVKAPHLAQAAKHDMIQRQNHVAQVKQAQAKVERPNHVAQNAPAKAAPNRPARPAKK